MSKDYFVSQSGIVAGTLSTPTQVESLNQASRASITRGSQTLSPNDAGQKAIFISSGTLPGTPIQSQSNNQQRRVRVFRVTRG
jgi:hypothetical protein